MSLVRIYRVLEPVLETVLIRLEFKVQLLETVLLRLKFSCWSHAVLLRRSAAAGAILLEATPAPAPAPVQLPGSRQ